MRKPVNWDRVHLQIHARRLTTAQAWFESAIELVASAEALSPLVLSYWDSLMAWQADKSRSFNEHAYHHVFLMLYGFAIENYCKGVLAMRLSETEREQLRSGGKFPARLNKHDLLRLVKAVDLDPITFDEEVLLRRLTHAVKWSGRYPVSRDYQGSFSDTLSDGKTYNLTLIVRDDVETVRALASRIRDHVGAPASYRLPPEYLARVKAVYAQRNKSG